MRRVAVHAAVTRCRKPVPVPSVLLVSVFRAGQFSQGAIYNRKRERGISSLCEDRVKLPRTRCYLVNAAQTPSPQNVEELALTPPWKRDNERFPTAETSGWWRPVMALCTNSSLANVALASSCWPGGDCSAL